MRYAGSVTRQAAPVTIEVDDDPVLWAVQGSFLDRSEARPVQPWHFAAWYEGERLKIASRLARWLRFTVGPRSISTALRLAVRLSLRGGLLRRRWVSFSMVDEAFLRGCRLPDAELAPGLVDNSVRFMFAEDEPPIAATREITLVPCELLAPLHYYPRRGADPRSVPLAPRTAGT